MCYGRSVIGVVSVLGYIDSVSNQRVAREGRYRIAFAVSAAWFAHASDRAVLVLGLRRDLASLLVRWVAVNLRRELQCLNWVLLGVRTRRRAFCKRRREFNFQREL